MNSQQQEAGFTVMHVSAMGDFKSFLGVSKRVLRRTCDGHGGPAAHPAPAGTEYSPPVAVMRHDGG